MAAGPFCMSPSFHPADVPERWSIIMTQLKSAREGIITEEMRRVAQAEGVDPGIILQGIKDGKIVILANKNKIKSRLCGVGEGLSVKVNANIGTSEFASCIEDELVKLQVAVESGADAVMDLSTGPAILETRRRIIEESPVPIGTVPIYQAAREAVERSGSVEKMTVDELFDAIENHAAEGVDFVTVHCGLTYKAAEKVKEAKRLLGVVSRGGSILVRWMLANNKENPLLEHYDRLLDIAKRYDVTLSLGDGLRPGSIFDATDELQISELVKLGELVQVAWDDDVQVMVEGPGHVTLDQVAENIRLQKVLCKGAPFYVLGPLVTDSAAGYDHIACAIGGALAAYTGADFLCYVTPAEHLGLPGVEDVREGVIACKIAGHAADLARRRPAALAKDRAMAIARKELDWENQIRLCPNPAKAKRYREASEKKDLSTCTMCGNLCAVKLINELNEV